MNDSPSKPKHDDRPEAEALLIAYRATGDVGYRNRVVELYLPLVWKIAGNHKAKAHMPVDELYSYGIDGLMAAAETWAPEENVSFGYYAGRMIRLRGIAEGLRSMAQSTRTQRERGEAKTFSRLSAVGSEGAREHRDFAAVETADEYDETIRMAPMSWPERLIVRLTFKEHWTEADIAEVFDCDELAVKRIVKAITARLGDGTVETAPKVASMKHRAKVALAAAEREMRDVLADVAKFERAKMRKTVVQLLESLWLRRASEDYPWTGEFVRRVVKAAAERRVALLPLCW